MIPMKNVEIARVQEGDLTSEDLDQFVSNFDPKSHKVPVTIGHPDDNKPAWGWLKSVYRKGISLFSDMEIYEGLKKLLDEKLFSERSISFYPDYQGTGKKVLRHLGFLGAVPPQIKGMESLSFKDEGGDFLTVEFEEDQTSRSKIRLTGDALQKVRDFLIEEYGLEKADGVLAQYLVDELKNTPFEPSNEGNLLNVFEEKKTTEKVMENEKITYSEKQFEAGLKTELEKQKVELTKTFSDEVIDFKDQIKTKDAEIKTLSDKVIEIEKELTKIATEKKEGEITNFVDGLVKDLKLQPTEKESTIALLKKADESFYKDYKETLSNRPVLVNAEATIFEIKPKSDKDVENGEFSMTKLIGEEN